MKVTAPDIAPTLKAFKALDKAASAELRDASVQIASDMAPRTKAAASTRMQRRVAQSVKVRRDRVPVLVAGGRGLPGVLVAGSEFGGGQRVTSYQRRNRTEPGSHRVRRHTTVQFGPHRGKDGAWFYPTFRDNQDEIFDRWRAAVDELLTKWASGG